MSAQPAMPGWLRDLAALIEREMPGWLREMQNNAYSKPGYPDWLKLDDANWETFEAFEDLQRSREAAWEEHSDDREHALRVWREAAGLAASAQPAWSSYALAAGGWWERPRRAVVW